MRLAPLPATQTHLDTVVVAGGTVAANVEGVARTSAGSLRLRQTRTLRDRAAEREELLRGAVSKEEDEGAARRLQVRCTHELHPAPARLLPVPRREWKRCPRVFCSLSPV